MRTVVSTCHVCGEDFTISESGVATHIGNDEVSSFDLDANHVPFSVDNNIGTSTALIPLLSMKAYIKHEDNRVSGFSVLDVYEIDFKKKEVTLGIDGVCLTGLTFDEVELMRFTGFYDKHDCPIFEYDLVKDEDGRIMSVYWNDHNAQFKFKAEIGCDFVSADMWSWFNPSSVEHAGNVLFGSAVKKGAEV